MNANVVFKINFKLFMVLFSIYHISLAPDTIVLGEELSGYILPRHSFPQHIVPKNFSCSKIVIFLCVNSPLCFVCLCF